MSRALEAKRAFFEGYGRGALVSSLTVADLRFSTLGGLLRRDEIFQSVGTKGLCGFASAAVTRVRCGLLRPGLPVLVVVVNGLDRSET